MSRPNYESDLKNIRYPVSKSLIPTYKNFNCGDGWDRPVVVSYPYMGLDKYKISIPFIFNSDDILDDLGKMVDGLGAISSLISDASNRLSNWKDSISTSAGSVTKDVIERAQKYYNIAKSIKEYWDSETYGLVHNEKDGSVSSADKFSSSYRKYVSWSFKNPDIFYIKICRELSADHSTEELNEMYGDDFNSTWWEKDEVNIEGVSVLNPRYAPSTQSILFDAPNDDGRVRFSCSSAEKLISDRNADLAAFKKFFLAALLNARCAQEYVSANYVYERNKAAFPKSISGTSVKRATVLLPQEEIPIPGIETSPIPPSDSEKKSSLPLLLGAAALMFVLGKKK